MALKVIRKGYKALIWTYTNYNQNLKIIHLNKNQQLEILDSTNKINICVTGSKESIIDNT